MSVRADVARRGSSPVDLAVLGGAAVFLVAVIAQCDQPFTTPRVLLLSIAAPWGLLQVGRAAVRGDVAARLLAAYLGWALIATVTSPRPQLAWFGGYGTDRGWVFLAAFAACWGIGRRLGPWGRERLPPVLVAGLGVSAVVGVAQVVLDLGGTFATAGGRANGLVASSVYFGGAMAGALAIAAALAGRERRWVLVLPLVALFAAALNASGSRVALAAGLVVAAVAVRRAGARRWVGVAVAVAIGIVATLGLGAGSGTARTSDDAGGGFAPRLAMWDAGLRVAVRRPLVGVGPGRFRPATSNRTTAAFARAEGPDREFFDAHDVVVEQVVTTGFVGAALLGGFAVVAARRAGGPLALMAAAVAFTWALEPVSIATAPLALLALGAAGPLDAGKVPAPSGRWRPAVRVGALAAATVAVTVLGGAVVAADHWVAHAKADADLGAIRRAQQLLPPDAVLLDLERQILDRRAVGRELGPRRRMVEVARRAVAADPTRAAWWVALGYAEARATPEKAIALAEARRAFTAALRRNPWSAAALDGMRRVARAEGDRTEQARWTRDLCRIGVPEPGCR